jgi:hypothetical protein
MKLEVAMSATRITSEPLPSTDRHCAVWLRPRPLLTFFGLVYASLLLPAALTGSVYLQVALIGNAVVVAGAAALVMATRGRLGQRTVSPGA